jgi:hypothetical protein
MGPVDPAAPTAPAATASPLPKPKASEMLEIKLGDAA